jgi:TPR repeat protein
MATFVTPKESEIPSFQVLINAPVCERQGIRIRADRGDKDAAYALGAAYRRGGVIWRENPEAYFWFSIAEKLGHPDAQRMRLETAKYLNSPQIDRMRDRVEKWVPSDGSSIVQ